MLVISRKKNQSFRIGDDIHITVTEIRDSKVRLGIVAPSNVKILREELFDRKPMQKRMK